MRNTQFQIVLGLAIAAAAVPAVAQQNPAKPQNVVPQVTVSSSQVSPTPEMWLYEQQLREYLDPAMATRKAAEFRATQRRNRIAAMKWFGFSNQRPSASPDPFNGEYSPSWVGNNNLYPSRWSGTGRPWVVLRPNETNY